MSIQIKKIGNKEYAYLAHRNGAKVVHKYLGSASDAKVVAKIAEQEAGKKVPDEYRSLFWDTDPDHIDLKKNAKYIIERVLEVGNMGALGWIQRLYPAQMMIEVIETSRKITEKSRNFWKIWFGVADAY